MANNPIAVDSSKCVGCGLCVKDCPNGHLFIENGKAKAKADGCIECGHCFAICPQNAVEMNNYDTSDCGDVVPLTDFDSDKLLQAMKSRRSVRHFKDMPVEQEVIDKILEAGRYSPTGANSQGVRYTILGSKQDEIEKECVGLFRKGFRAASPFVRLISNINIDDKFFFKGAPLVIVVSGNSSIDAGLASSYMELMAGSLGLGVFYSGFFVICSKLSPKIRKLLSLDKKEKVFSCLVIGYPDVKYQRIVPRKNLKVKKL